jgi:hypothetical protein
MESKIFIWHEGWDIQDTMTFSFYNCEILQDFGYLRKGEEYSSIYVDYENGELTPFDDNDQEMEVIKMKLVPVE